MLITLDRPVVAGYTRAGVLSLPFVLRGAGGGLGAFTAGAVVNASLYDIVASLRADWNWSTSPGGLATGGYWCGAVRCIVM